MYFYHIIIMQVFHKPNGSSLIMTLQGDCMINKVTFFLHFKANSENILQK